MRAALSLGITLFVSMAALAQSNVGVEVEEVIDNRFPAASGSPFAMSGALELRLTLTGNNLDKAAAARVIVKEAKDDKGNSLTSASDKLPDFMPREYNNGTVQVHVNQPARAASTVRIKGTIELYVPTRDPNASITIANALQKLDVPLSSKALKAAKLELTPLSRDGYTAAAKARKITDADIAKLTAEAKKQGASDEDVKMAVELAKAFEGMDAEQLGEHTVILSGKKSDFDRLYRVDVLGGDNAPIHVGSRSTSTRGESSIMLLQPADAPPANAALQLMLVTDKSKVSFPFDVKVQLP
jgi:hypothetical protein